MEEAKPDISSAATDSPLRCELLILHTVEAQEWAAYLQMILKSSQKFQKRSILLYAISQADELHAYNFEHFQSSKCIVLLLTAAFLELLTDPELRGGLQSLLYPPYRVVALLCGVSEDDMLTENFEHWPYWRKLYADDDPNLYITSILESINNSTQEEIEQPPLMNVTETLAMPELELMSDTFVENQLEEAIQEEREEIVLNKIDNAITGDSTSSLECVSCLTIQPNRVLCGEHVTMFIILKQKVDQDQSSVEVEFLSQNAASTLVQGTLENEYTVSVAAPDMPSGKVSLIMHTNQTSLNLMSVTYYTNMEEVNRCIDNASAPIEFICQAFNITSNIRESLDNMLTDSLKSRMPPNGLQLFGIRQIEEQNMAACQRNEELPTLLHFAARYGLKKLTTTLLKCPGALQAYSVMNKNGDYPNTLAERSGFTELRQFIDEFVETADMLKTHIRDSMAEGEDCDVYEDMSLATSQDIIMKLSGQNEDIYESMLAIDPECADDLYEAINGGGDDQNPEEAILRKFFQAKPEDGPSKGHMPHQNTKDMREEGQNDPAAYDEEDPYDLSAEDIYHALEENEVTVSEVHNRPPAPVPRPEVFEESQPYISRGMTSDDLSAVFSVEPARPTTPRERITSGACPAKTPSTLHDPYAGMKTPGQKQLITLQERVKDGEITVDEAVQEFKTWQFDHERRASSLRYQQENLKRLRDSITRRHKERVKMGLETEYEISAPVLANPYSRSSVTLECAVYEPTPAPIVTPLSRPFQRSNWKTGSTSSTSSSESNRHSTISSSSGAISEQELEEIESIAPPPRPPRVTEAPPPRVTEAPPYISPPRVPPRIPERIPENTNERYISCPTRALPQRPVLGEGPPPPVPRRFR